GENGKLVGAINAARRLPDGRWIGDMFDGRGYVGALRAHGVSLEGKRVHMIGAGGVARAMAFSLAQAGAARIRARDPDVPSVRDLDRRRAIDLAGALRAAFPPIEAEALDVDRYACDILANATPLGMRDDDPLPCDPERFAPGTMSSRSLKSRPCSPPHVHAVA